MPTPNEPLCHAFPSPKVAGRARWLGWCVQRQHTRRRDRRATRGLGGSTCGQRGRVPACIIAASSTTMAVAVNLPATTHTPAIAVVTTRVHLERLRARHRARCGVPPREHVRGRCRIPRLRTHHVAAIGATGAVGGPLAWFRCRAGGLRFTRERPTAGAHHATTRCSLRRVLWRQLWCRHWCRRRWWRRHSARGVRTSRRRQRRRRLRGLSWRRRRGAARWAGAVSLARRWGGAPASRGADVTAAAAARRGVVAACGVCAAWWGPVAGA